MTKTIFPAISGKGSTRFNVSIDGSPVATRARTKATQFSYYDMWSQGEAIQVSWMSIAADEVVNAVVSLASGPITDYRLFTNSPTPLTSSLSGGAVTVSIPPGMYAWVQANGRKGEPIILGNKPIYATPTGPLVDTYNGTQTKAAAGRTLVFPAGIHDIGRLFKVETGAKVFVPGDAWVTGSFDYRGSIGTRTYGHGSLSGELVDPAYVRTLPYDEQVLYSLLVGDGASSNNVVEGITLVDSPFYSNYYGITTYRNIDVFGPWWANTNGFFPAQDYADGNKSLIDNCCAFVMDDCCDLSEYTGAPKVSNSLFGTVAAATLIVAYWPGRDYGLSSVVENVNAIAFQTYTPLGHDSLGTGHIVLAWCDGGAAGPFDDPDEETHVVGDYFFDRLRVFSSDGLPIKARIFEAANRPYPIEWGVVFPGQQLGQIKNWRIKDLWVETVPASKMEFVGKDRLNTPHDFSFENCLFGGTLLTTANWATYAVSDQLIYNFFINGAPLRPAVANTGSWFDTNPAVSPWSFRPLLSRRGNGLLMSSPDVWYWPSVTAPSQGPYAGIGSSSWGASVVNLAVTMAGSSTMQAGMRMLVGLGATMAGSSTMQASATGRLALASLMQGSSSMQSSAGSTSSVALGVVMAGSSSAQFGLASLTALRVTMAGGSSAFFDPTPIGTVLLSVVMAGTSSMVIGATLIPNNPTTPPGVPGKREFMKQRIHNALRALVTNGPYYSCVISPKNGQMTIDFTKPVPVVGVTLRELEKNWRPAQHYRRGFAVSELESWPWEAVVEFPAGLSIACEVFEENATAGGITIPPVIGLPDQRTLLATLVHCEYNHPPEQSPSRGTVAVFGFEIVPATLRK